jgi:predicted alpha-1,6-mannanase (GH76 family)
MRFGQFGSHQRLRSALLLACIFVGAASAWVQQPVQREREDASPQERAALAIGKLQSWFNPKKGLYDTTGWWNSANAITTLADYSRVTNDRQYADVFPTVFSAAQDTSKGFLNDYYDDEGWWALAWIDVYDVTHEQRYFDMAESIFADMATGWDGTCRGGIWWSKERKYKNAIANELFLSVAAHLATRSNDKQAKDRYLHWAKREWKWFSHSGMINGDHQINDGLDASCRNNGKTTWTYNQGVVLGGLTELYSATQAHNPLAEANAIAAATLANSTLVDKRGIFHEPCEPDCGADGTQFKGIFVRNLALLYGVAPRPTYKDFIVTNADSIWKGMQVLNSEIGTMWSPQYGKANASTQSSGADALVAAAEVKSR